MGSFRVSNHNKNINMPNWKKLVISGSDASLTNLQLTNIANAGTDTGKFLVLDSSDNVDYRTGAEVLSDIGGQVSLTNPVTGTGTTNFFPIWSNGVNNTLQNSQLQQSNINSSGTYAWKFNNADRVIIDKPSSVTSGDPEFLITQDNNYKFSMGWDDDGAGFGYLYNWSGNGIRLGAAGANPVLEILTDNTDPRVYINGNVGIGTTSPGYKLNITNTDNTQTSLDSLTFRAVSENYAGTVGVFENTSGINTSIEIKDTVDSMFLVSRNGIGSFGPSGGWSSSNINISAAGNVGIGDRNPSTDHRLTVKRSGGYGIKVDGTQIGFYQGTTFRGSIGPEYDSSLFDINGQDNIRFKINNSLIGRWNSAGNLGIGTQDPDFPLDINQGGASARIWNTSGTPSLELRGHNGQINFTDGDTAGIEFLMINRGTNFAFKESGTGQDYIYISTSGSSNGNVGIGPNFDQQNLPSSTLEVAGGIKVANDSDAASADKVGTLRYRESIEDVSYSYVDMCMRTGASTYEWVNIVQNNW